jgi:hypothetical protein
MDASEEDSSGVFFIYREHLFAPEQLIQAKEHTEFLIAHLTEMERFQKHTLQPTPRLPSASAEGDCEAVAAEFVSDVVIEGTVNEERREEPTKDAEHAVIDSIIARVAHETKAMAALSAEKKKNRRSKDDLVASTTEGEGSIANLSRVSYIDSEESMLLSSQASIFSNGGSITDDGGSATSSTALSLTDLLDSEERGNEAHGAISGGKHPVRAFLQPLEIPPPPVTYRRMGINAVPDDTMTPPPDAETPVGGCGALELAAEEFGNEAERIWGIWMRDNEFASGGGEQKEARLVSPSKNFEKILANKQFWKSLQGNGGNTTPLQTAAASLVRQTGVAPSMRRALWLLWSGATDLRARYPEEDMYMRLVQGDERAASHLPECFQKINQDVESTCAEIYYFQYGDGAAALRRILVAFCRLGEGEPAFSYEHGMSLLAAFVLLTFRGSSTAAVTEAAVEADAFWTFSAIVTTRVGGYFQRPPGEGLCTAAQDSTLNSPQELLQDTALLELLVERHAAPATANQLRALEFSFLACTSEWFQALYFDFVPPAVALHLWDIIIFHGGGGSGYHDRSSSSPSSPLAVSTTAVIAWIALGLVELTADFLASCTSFHEVIILLRTAAIELKHLDEVRQVSPLGCVSAYHHP